MADLFFEDEELEGERTPYVAPARHRRRRWPLIVLALVALALVVAVAAGAWVKNRIDPPGGQGEEVTVEIPLGSSTTAWTATGSSRARWTGWTASCSRRSCMRASVT